MNTTDALSRLKQAGVWSKKNLGQHFLIDETVLEAIVSSGNVTPTDTVIEIGPGLGVLSRELLARDARVIAFEYDQDMVGILEEDLPELEVVSGDVLITAPVMLPELGDYKVIANIPYQITTPLLRLFLEAENAPASLTLLIQKEVAERLAAGPKKSGRGYLSVMTEYFGDITYVRSVPATAFWPAPEVESAVIHIKIHQSRIFSGPEEKEFLTFVHRLFIQPRKQLKNVIAGIKGVDQSEVVTYLAQFDLPETIRAQELSLQQWAELFRNPFNTQ